jgi:hypothetical protein
MNEAIVFPRLSRFWASHLLFGAKGPDGQVISVYSRSNADRSSKSASSLDENPCRNGRVYGNLGLKVSDTAAHGLCVPGGRLVSSGQVAFRPTLGAPVRFEVATAG